MVLTLFLLLVIFVIVALIWGSPLLRKVWHSNLKREPFPLHWVRIIEKHLPIYQSLSEPMKRQLHGHIQVFLAEKQFIGCRGLLICDEIKLTIAANACLLLFNERGEYFPKLCSILVYPSAYRVKQTKLKGDYVIEEQTIGRLGESWRADQVVLSWEQILVDATHWQDGHNLILHEFAHQLDTEDGTVNGVPILEASSSYHRWSQVFSQEYKRLCQDAQRGHPTVMDKYGATNPAEFFAVATETFFEKPLLLKKKHHRLYGELKRYYNLDPVNLKQDNL